MAKKDALVEDAERQQQEEREKRLAERTYLAESSDWDKADGMEYGGQADIVDLEIGEVAGPFTYVGRQAMTLDTGDTTVHIAQAPDNTSVRLPISAAFLRAIDQAGVKPGDKLLMRRADDQEKKRGKGKGTPMKIFSAKVTHRTAPVAATV